MDDMDTEKGFGSWVRGLQREESTQYLSERLIVSKVSRITSQPCTRQGPVTKQSMLMVPNPYYTCGSNCLQFSGFDP